MSEEAVKAQSDFLSFALEFLASRPDSQIMIIVEGPKGFETLRSGAGTAWALGAIQLANEALLHQFHASRNPEIERQRAEEEQNKINAIAQSTKEKPN